MRNIAALNNHPMPIRIQVTGNRYMLQMGFISPSRGNGRPRCSIIKIGGDAHQKFEYSFERIEDTGITYLDIGNIPSQKYYLSYENPSAHLTKFWPSTTPGMISGGTFFDAASGRMLQTGSKASPGKSYYLLQRAPMYQFEIPNGITKARVYVWIEGQDVDSLETDSEGAEVEIGIDFTKDTAGWDAFDE
jgi:hypothetical protein